MTHKALALALLLTAAPAAEALDFTEGKPEIRSMSVLTFGPDGVLYVGDGKSAAVWAIDLEEEASAGEALEMNDVETKIGALLGTTAGDVMIHDLAVSPVSHHAYLAVSRGRGEWDSAWELPNDIADANVLLRVRPGAKIEAIDLDRARYARAALPNPVDGDKKHRWKEGISLRVDTITDMAVDGDVLYVTGLSNEEFASTLWKVPLPFGGQAAATTLEIYHGAHGAWETQAPIRTFIPYQLKGESHLLAAYLCTPFVTFKVDELADGKHVKGRTLAEFGSGNYPLDMVAYKKGDQDRVLIANSNLPLMVVDAQAIAEFEGEITGPLDTYMAGLPYEPRSGAGVQQLDLLDETQFVALQRLPGGTLDLVSMPIRRY